MASRPHTRLTPTSEHTVHSRGGSYTVRGAMHRNPRTGRPIPVVDVLRGGKPIRRLGQDTLADHLADEMVIKMTKRAGVNTGPVIRTCKKKGCENPAERGVVWADGRGIVMCCADHVNYYKHKLSDVSTVKRYDPTAPKGRRLLPLTMNAKGRAELEMQDLRIKLSRLARRNKDGERVNVEERRRILNRMAAVSKSIYPKRKRMKKAAAMEFAEKLAAEDDKGPMHPAAAAALGLTGAGVVANPTVRGSALGYKGVYHGTPTAAGAVREKGLDPALGGADTGAKAATGSDQFVEHSKGKVHVTPTPLLARPYAHMDEISEALKSGDETEAGKRFALSHLKRPGRDRLITADLPMDQWDRFEVDPDSSGVTEQDTGAKHWAGKEMAARSDEAVDPKYIHNRSPSRAAARTLDFVKKLPGYVKAHPGRFGLGVLGLGAGTAAVGKGGLDLARSGQAALEERNKTASDELAEKLAGCTGKPHKPQDNLKPKGNATERFVQSRTPKKKERTPLTKQEKARFGKTAEEKLVVGKDGVPTPVKAVAKRMAARIRAALPKIAEEKPKKPALKITRKEHNVIKAQLKSQEKKRKAQKDLEKLVGTKPTPAQLARYAAIGGGVGSVLHPVGTLLEGVPKGKSLAREALSARKILRGGASGATFMALTPVAKYHIDRYAARKGAY